MKTLFSAPLGMGMVVDEFKLVPLEIQADPTNCGKSPQITWVPYYAASHAAELTCENYSMISADSSSQTYVIYDHLKYNEPWNKPVFCIQDFPSSFLDGTEAATTFKITCEKMPETTAAPTTRPTRPPTEPPTTIPVNNQYPCCEKMLAYFNIFHQFPGELTAPLVQSGYSDLYDRPTFRRVFIL